MISSGVEGACGGLRHSSGFSSYVIIIITNIYITCMDVIVLIYAKQKKNNCVIYLHT